MNGAPGRPRYGVDGFPYVAACALPAGLGILVLSSLCLHNLGHAAAAPRRRTRSAGSSAPEEPW